MDRLSFFCFIFKSLVVILFLWKKVIIDFILLRIFKSEGLFNVLFEVRLSVCVKYFNFNFVFDIWIVMFMFEVLFIVIILIFFLMFYFIIVDLSLNLILYLVWLFLNCFVCKIIEYNFYLGFFNNDRWLLSKILWYEMFMY